MWLPADVDAVTALFSESAARAVVQVRASFESEFAGLCAAREVPVAELGRTGGDSLDIDGQFVIGIDELATAHQGVLPAIFG